MDRAPSRTVVTFHLRRDEYPLFTAAIEDERLPSSYEEWFRRNAHTEHAHRFAGLNVQQISIRFYEFLEYARRAGGKASYGMLLGFAIYLARRPSPFESGGPPEEREGTSLRTIGAQLLSVDGQGDDLFVILHLEGGGALVVNVSRRCALELAECIAGTRTPPGKED
jgi:hypothetical protein